MFAGCLGMSSFLCTAGPSYWASHGKNFGYTVIKYNNYELWTVTEIVFIA